MTFDDCSSFVAEKFPHFSSPKEIGEVIALAKWCVGPPRPKSAPSREELDCAIPEWVTTEAEVWIQIADLLDANNTGPNSDEETKGFTFAHRCLAEELLDTARDALRPIGSAAMKDTKIEWANHTFNPWIGCAKVSAGCKNCYAETLMDTRYGRVKWGKGNHRSRTSDSYWNQPLKWNLEAADPKLGTRPARPRVFCASLADWLDEGVPIEWLADLIEVIQITPHLDWQLLTKRPEGFRDKLCRVLAHMLDEEIGFMDSTYDFVRGWISGSPPPNIWIGTSVENQAMADKRIPELLKIPAKVRFLSCEPLLGPIDLRAWTDRCSYYCDHGAGDGYGHRPERSKIDWVICGGESGREARPMHPDWARSLRNQCQAAGVPFFFKQWGEWIAWEFDEQQFNEVIYSQHGRELWNDDAPRDLLYLPKGWDVFWFEEGDITLCQCVGKQAAGRLLDGREWNQFPAPGSPLQTPISAEEGYV